MSLLAKAREGGAAYIYSVVTGDTANDPHGLTIPVGKFYDPYIAGDMSSYWTGDPAKAPVGGFIAMPPPLTADKVTFDDGTKASLKQEAYDVAPSCSGPPTPRWRSASGWAYR